MYSSAGTSYWIVFFLVIIFVLIAWVSFYPKINAYSGVGSCNKSLVAKCLSFKNWSLFTNAISLRKVSQFCDNTFIEIIWASTPALILVLVVMLPSFSLLYFLDQKVSYGIEDAPLTVKVVGRQWYWDYENFYLSSDSSVNSNNFSI